jgi:hypothetical protein
LIRENPVLEHVSAEGRVSRVRARQCTVGWFVLSTPLHLHRWHEFDRVVGHARRYEPRALVDLRCGSGFALEGFALFGMRGRGAAPVLCSL